MNLSFPTTLRPGSQTNFWRVLLFNGMGLLFTGCHTAPPQASNTPVAPPPASPAPVQHYTKEAQLIAVGDIMMHGSQIRSGYNPTTGSYNYDNFFSQVKDILSQGNWVIANLETPLAGAETGYTGYPLFNAPDALADSIKQAGFNILTTANNHALDRGEKGVLTTLENIQKRGLYSAGTYASLEASQKILMLEQNQITMAILAYTYGTNGIPIPPGKDYLVSLINEPKILEDIAKARRQGAEIVTVVLHFGTEYQRQPSPEQKRLVHNLASAGADIILGSHPHVVQPYQIFDLTDETGKPRKAVAIYSMGNFVSNQRGNYKDLGVIFQVKLRKRFPEKTMEIAEVKALPTWVHRYSAQGQYQFRVLPLPTLLSTQNDPLLVPQEYPPLQAYLDQMNQHLTSLMPAQSVATPAQ